MHLRKALSPKIAVVPEIYEPVLTQQPIAQPPSGEYHHKKYQPVCFFRHKDFGLIPQSKIVCACEQPDEKVREHSAKIAKGEAESPLL
ncbi:MAG: hypothetical protein IJS39_16280 [Synergistaceae bacterium]|nr:hypothetical protein [Synergistaceae bacterium]